MREMLEHETEQPAPDPQEEEAAKAGVSISRSARCFILHIHAHTVHFDAAALQSLSPLTGEDAAPSAQKGAP